MSKSDLEQHKTDALKLLKELDTMKCNISDMSYPWEDIVENRKVAVNEFLTFLETGNTKHIRVSEEDAEILYEHFK